MLSYVAKHSNQRKTAKLIKLQLLASILSRNDKQCWVTSQNTQNNPKLKKVIILWWICIYLISNRSKILSYVAKHSKQRKSTKAIKLQWIASIWRHNDQKCWVTSQNIKNIAKVQKRSNYDEFASIWCQIDQNNAKQQNTSNYDEFASIWHPKCWVTSQFILNNTKLQK